MQSFVDENFQSNQVQWLGRRNDVPELMAKAKLLIHCAKQEPLGRVLLEAAASGLPMVTTRVGGTPEILTGHEELMFEPERIAEDGVDVATKLLQNGEFHQDVSQQLRQIAEMKFSAERAGTVLVNCYLEVVGKP